MLNRAEISTITYKRPFSAELKHSPCTDFTNKTKKLLAILTLTIIWTSDSCNSRRSRCCTNFHAMAGDSHLHRPFPAISVSYWGSGDTDTSASSMCSHKSSIYVSFSSPGKPETQFGTYLMESPSTRSTSRCDVTGLWHLQSKWTVW